MRMDNEMMLKLKLIEEEKNCAEQVNVKNANFQVIDQNNNNEIITENVTTIRKFYENAEIFVTGGTGFLGKALIEKLLRSCEGIKHIYILLRPKRGLTSEQRYKEFIKNPIFDRIRHMHPEYLDKIVCIAGDINASALILDEYYKDKVLNTVNIVFHVAATVRFNESLRDAADLNMLGTQRVLDMCCQMKQIKSFVHVSTAYSNPNRCAVDEVVYATHPVDKQTFINCLNTFGGDKINLIADRLQGTHPNTYTLTKSMAESIVADYGTKFPICIIRPSIVTGALNEPFPGWVDNISGITGIMMEIGRGTLTSILCEQNGIVDLIPVDIVVRTLIAAAWENTFTLLNNIQVYNCTSGTMNPIKWVNFGRLTEKYARKNPSKYVMLCPGFKFRTNQIVHKFYEIFYHFCPALLFDVIMRVQGNKPIMMKIARKFKIAADGGTFFAMHEWQFENKNFARLIRNVRMTDDSEEFDCTVAWDWDSYVENYMLGIRKYVLKDGEESMESARRKVKRLLWIKRIFQIGILIIIYNYIVKPLFDYFL